ncbi:MAG: hypothetical protein JO321_04865 [Solirubrobacterales bacterium]|nr:hypothetical protein [Solirubrobacterales bacterium]MBV8942466.1 hypothetical protein [Solirubrobacterales bacterium]MBV9164826.1 hypothetical protein [Solirubrobacterales bacterium]MBV9534730.1 hypothetical protein [Solirubrobacterales bacterium]
MNEVHIVTGVAAIAVNALAGCWGAWAWWRARPSAWFWRLLRLGQLAVVTEVVAGGIFYLIHRHAPSLHVLYGVLPVAVSFIAEGLRVSSAQTVLDKHGHASAQAVGKLPEAQQRVVVLEIVRREIGVMTLSALVIVGLLARAAGTG